MGLQRISGLLASTLLAINSVQATPFSNSINARDLFVPSTTCDNLNLGSGTNVIGKVCIQILDGTLTVSYDPISPYTYTDVHVYVGTVAPTNRAPGSFPYSSDPGGVCSLSTGNTTASCTIPVDPSWRTCGQKLYIATHASVTSVSSGGGTAWGAGTCFGTTTGNCAKYWYFYTQCYCKTTSIFEPTTYKVSHPSRPSLARTHKELNLTTWLVHLGHHIYIDINYIVLNFFHGKDIHTLKLKNLANDAFHRRHGPHLA
jgi:hypothetical protein